MLVKGATDHKAVLGLPDHDKSISVMISHRVQRCVVALSAYDYKLLEYRRGADNGNTDFPLCLSLDKTFWQCLWWKIQFDEVVNTSPVKVEQIHEWPNRDTTLAQLYELLKHGWPDGVKSDTLNAYYNRRSKLTV